MIQYNESSQFFHLQSALTSYVIRIYPSNHLGHVYYGNRLKDLSSIESLQMAFKLEVGNQVIYDQNDKSFNLNLSLMEVSTYGKGDFRDPMLHFRLPDGSRITDFTYVSYEITKGKPRFPEMPETFGTDQDPIETLKITLEDSHSHLQCDLYYSVFEEADVVTRRCVIHNHGNLSVVMQKALSMNLDFPNEDYELISLDGAWIRERHPHIHDLTYGILKIDSKKGVSSNDHNPFIAIKKKHTDEEVGKCYGFALIYSGNFEALVEVSPHNLIRVLMGINSFDFEWTLEAQESFVTPEVVLTYSDSGLSKLSQNFHQLINKHLIQPDWQAKERPVLVNNWEATFFDFNERKLMKLAKSAKKLGMELFVLDDGWFGKRDDDTSSLGDWFADKRKLPNGISGLAKKINKIGLDFGIWVEPEMVNENSELYQKHPDWAIQHPNIKPSLGRNQLILDLTNQAVRDYLVETLSTLFTNANIRYCKWDMNRNFSDCYSTHLLAESQGKFFHLYTLGLYEVLDKITKRFPNILFEGCASGGNRFDMGILYYMPQIWTSDNTDARERIRIQTGTSYVYPQSTMGAHVSNVPNLQTLRVTPLETRFNVACFGVLGYELDLTRLSPMEKKTIRAQITYYKRHRSLFQFGKLVRFQNPFTDNRSHWLLVSDNQKEALMGIYQTLSLPNGELEKFPLTGMDPTAIYSVQNRTQYFNLSTFGDLIRHALPIRLNANGIWFHLLKNRYLLKAESEYQEIAGDVLLNHGFVPKQPFIGSGYNSEVRLMGDFGSRIYHFQALKEESL